MKLRGITPEWLEVYLPIQLNGITGWMLASEFNLESHPHRAEVDLAYL